MLQVNIRMKQLLKNRLQYAAIDKNQSLQETIIEYLILGIALERNLESNKNFELPPEFEVIKETILLDV